MRQLRLAMAQINTTVGDFARNSGKILRAIAEARSLGADLVTFPELAVCGYPPEDLLLKPQFISANLEALDRIREACSAIAVVVGFVDAAEDVFNAAAVIYDGRVVDVYHKIYLPNYGVFDENRYFRAGNECPVYDISGVRVGVSVCEDIWYEAGPATAQAVAGAEVIVNISASPYRRGKGDHRERMLAARAADNVAIVAQCNLVGGQDELVFDGNSVVLDEHGRLLARGRQFEEDLVVVDIDVDGVFRSRLSDSRLRKGAPALGNKEWKTSRKEVSQQPCVAERPPLRQRALTKLNGPDEVYAALVLGTRDYVGKNGFEKVVIGLSGGIDSSLVAVIAADALGVENVVGVSMPSRYSSPGSASDADVLARNLGIRLMTVSIDGVFQACLDALSGAFAGTAPDVAEENVQARIRGNLLMALSNKFGWLVLTTGNKSEMATGYTTLYGDMAGGFAVIKDVTKTMVYELALYRNSIASEDVIPSSVMGKQPSAELRPDQADTDSLPPYDVLDPVLEAYVEQDKSVDQLVAMGFEQALGKRVAQLVDGSEYKRRQAPPGVKTTPKAFGRDRRLPITNRFRGL